MGAEYYLIKPNKKEKFYLGKNIQALDGIPEVIRGVKPKTSIIYEDYLEFFRDFFVNNIDIFPQYWTLEQIQNVVRVIYFWIWGDFVYIDNDYNSTSEEWKDWKETGDLIDIFEQVDANVDFYDMSFKLKGEEDD